MVTLSDQLRVRVALLYTAVTQVAPQRKKTHNRPKEQLLDLSINWNMALH